MIRITTIFLCILLAAAAWGRYRAEVSVRETREELERLKVSKAEELRSIQVLRAEIAYLENPERLSKLARTETDLRPSERTQIMTARQFAEALGQNLDETAPNEDPAKGDVIFNALAMAEPSGGE